MTSFADSQMARSNPWKQSELHYAMPGQMYGNDGEHALTSFRINRWSQFDQPHRFDHPEAKHASGVRGTRSSLLSWSKPDQTRIISDV